MNAHFDFFKEMEQCFVLKSSRRQKSLDFCEAKVFCRERRQSPPQERRTAGLKNKMLRSLKKIKMRARIAKMKNGLTALETILAAALMVAIAVMVVSVFSSFRDARELDRAESDIMNLIREARARTLASEGGSNFGVHFESSRAVLFKGAGFAEGAPDNEILNISDRIEIFNINLSSNSAVFERLTGNAAPWGDVSIRLKTNPAKLKTVFINAAGLIYVQ